MREERDKMIGEIKLRLGHGMIDLELDPEHYDYAITATMDRYRQRSSNSMQESFLFLDVQPDVAAYTLPNEVQEVRSVYRRTVGGTAGGSNVDPFALAFTNNLYMVQNPGGMSMGSGGTGFLATYELASQFNELVGRMFGRDVLFTFDPVSKRVVFQRRFGSVEQVCLHVYNQRLEHMILQDVYARPWIRDYATAMCKLMIGEARSLFSGGLGGPQGGVSLNGDSMKSEAKEEMDRLEDEIKKLG